MSENHITTAAIRQMADALSQLASEYRELAEKAEKAGVSSFKTSGADTFWKVIIRRAQGNLNRTEKFLRDHMRNQSRQSFDEATQASVMRKVMKTGEVKKKAKTPRKAKRNEA